MSHKIFEHVENFRDYLEPLGDTCEDITNHWRLFRDCFATHSRCLSPAVAKQSQSSEIGALIKKRDLSFTLIQVYKLKKSQKHKEHWSAEADRKHIHWHIYLRLNQIFGMFMESCILWVSCKVTLQGARSIHDSMNIPKIDFIAYVYILF